MCGLAGIFHLDGAPVDPAVLESMGASLAHRGPDDSGSVRIDFSTGRASVDPGTRQPRFDLGLAARRLAIQDLSPAGRMPMTDEDGALWIAYNGEIYNFKELRAELESSGQRFRTGTDTEVILAAYRAWGPDCLKRFNGMWAFALYDRRNKALFCSRDRLGIKPFYYYSDVRTFVFGSEIKAMLKHPAVPRYPDYRAVFNYLARSYRFVDGRPTTFFHNIRQIEPGRFLLVDREGLKEREYWRLDPAAPLDTGDEQTQTARFRELLEDSVRLRLRSDVDVAAQLSGGLDSSAAAALAAREKGPGLHTFSAAYDRPPFDEREFIQPTVEAIGAESHFVFPQARGLAETLPRMIRAFDEPVCTVTFYAHWRVMAEAARMGFKVILNGHGADELTAGYYDHFLHWFGDLRRAGANGSLTSEIQAWLANHGQYRAAGLEDYFRRLDQGVPYMTDYLKAFRPYENALEPDFLKKYDNFKPDESPFDGLLANRLYNELRYETVPAVLKAEDRVTMAHSIESRLPFLDYRLVEYAFRLPGGMKIRNGLNKYVQRRALKGIIPEKVRARVEKVGFNAPSEDWFRTELKTLLEETARRNRMTALGIFRPGGLDEILAAHQSGRANHYQFLWQVLNMEIWLAEYFDHAALP